MFYIKGEQLGFVVAAFFCKRQGVGTAKKEDDTAKSKETPHFRED